LKHTVVRSVILSIHPIIVPEDLPKKNSKKLMTRRAKFQKNHLSIRELEKRYVMKVLEETGGNKNKASEFLGIGRATLYRILEKQV
jgi:DNA-binding NtrC family response regulator